MSRARSAEENHRARLFAAITLLGAISGCTSAPSGSDASPADVGVDVLVDARASRCVGDEECEDGSYCNGRERCEPTSATADQRGCVASRGRPCLPAQTCDESMDLCITDCGASRDADMDGEDAQVCGGRDCDDADPLRHPGATEVCDDEDRDEDCDPTTFGTRDLDRDGATSSACCNVSTSGVRACGDDCNDVMRGVRPSASETCNGRDDDCNASVDEGATVPGFADADRDLHGDPSMPRMICAGSAGSSALDDDCDDARVSAHGAQVEICDALDNDCDGLVDEHARAVTWYGDRDGDGFGSASSGTMVSCTPLDGYSLLATDCADDNASINPAAAERCNGLDDDCDGLLNGTFAPGDFEDDDGDGHLDAACGGDDCDDQDWNAYAGAPEICDFRDSDCDGLSDFGRTPPAGVEADTTDEVDWLADVDQDGWGAGTPIHACEPQAGRTTRGGDCADDDYLRFPGALDACNGRDDDCDTRVDEAAVQIAYYADLDGDHDGAGAATLACRAAAGLTDLPGDCAPIDPTRGPSAIEICDGVDQDCDMAIDEALFRDVDGDGHGDPGAPVTGACMPGDVGSADDCNDAVSSLNPSIAEVCNLRDDDCDGQVDEAGAELCVAGATHGMCVAGRCSLTCATGTADCDGELSNGCEASLATDPRHCGDCVTDCGIAAACGGMTGCDDPIVDLTSAAYHRCALRRRGGVMCSGMRDRYLGVFAGLDGGVINPEAVPGFDDIVDLEASELATCGVRSTGDVVCVGMDGYGSLGYGLEGVGFHAARVVPGLHDALEIETTLTGELTCARESTGNVTCWGRWPFPGSHGDGTPARLIGVSDVVRMYGAGTDLIFVSSSGRTTHLGYAPVFYGTGDHDLHDITAVVGSPVTSLSLTVSSVGGCILRESGVAGCWGANAYAAQGDTVAGYPSVLRDVSTPWAGAVEIIGGNDYVMCARFADGAVRCSGICATFGLRGDGCTGPDPGLGTVVTGLDGASTGDLDDAVSLEAASHGGGNELCAVRRRGDVVCWGQTMHAGIQNVPIRLVTD